MKICINPGHGPKNVGYDPGAIGPTGLQEAAQTKEIALRVQEKLKANGHDVLLIQDGDLWDVSNKANKWGAEYFISIHCNAHTASSARGIETYYYKPGGMGEKMAKAIQSELIKATGLVDRGAKAGNLHVVRETNAPAILVEAGFISNPQEEALMKQANFDEKIAEAICIGFSKAVGVPYSTSAKKTNKPVLVVYGSDVEKRVAPYLAEWLKCEVRELGDRTLTKAYLEATFEKVYVLGNAAKLSSNTVNVVGKDRFDTARKTLDLCK